MTEQGPISDHGNVDYSGEIEGLGLARQTWRAGVKRHLGLWAIRWTVGFSIVAAVYYFNRDWTWLWWWALGLALALPALTLAVDALVNRKLRHTQQAWADLEGRINRGDYDNGRAE